jgi:hypothetical protein
MRRRFTVPFAPMHHASRHAAIASNVASCALQRPHVVAAPERRDVHDHAALHPSVDLDAIADPHRPARHVRIQPHVRPERHAHHHVAAALVLAAPAHPPDPELHAPAHARPRLDLHQPLLLSRTHSRTITPAPS